MVRFNLLDHFLLSGVLYDKCVVKAYALHDIDNMSDHDPILLDLGLDVQYVGFCTNVYTPHASWKKANDADLLNYRSALSGNLASLNLQTEVLTCHDIECDDNYHFHALADYVKGITDAGVNLCGNGWERSSHTYFQVGTPFPYLFIFSYGNAVPTAFRHYIH